MKPRTADEFRCYVQKQYSKLTSIIVGLNMADEISRQQFFEKNGFKMTNPYWAWSGVNEDKKLVLFNVWEHYKEKHNDKMRYIVLCDEWKHATESSKGFNDSERNINLVINGYYKLCIAIAEPTVQFAMCKGSRLKKTGLAIIPFFGSN